MSSRSHPRLAIASSGRRRGESFPAAPRSTISGRRWASSAARISSISSRRRHFDIEMPSHTFKTLLYPRLNPDSHRYGGLELHGSIDWLLAGDHGSLRRRNRLSAQSDLPQKLINCCQICLIICIFLPSQLSRSRCRVDLSCQPKFQLDMNISYLVTL